MIIVTAKTIKKLGDAPDKIVLFAEGWNELEAEKGEPARYFVDRRAFDAIVTNLRPRGIDIVIDYEHQTLSGEKAPAAGWIRGADALAYVDGVGITASVDWTAEAAGHIERAEYRYFSPVFAVRKADDRPAALFSVALTNTPKHNHLKPILAKLGSQLKPMKEETMNFFKMLFEKLGLAEGADETQTLAAVDAVVAKAKTADKPVVAKEIPEALGIDAGSDVSTVVASIHAMRQNGKAEADARIAALEAKIAERDAAEAVTAAMNAGKITPDQKDWAIAYAKKDLAGFTTFVTKAAVVVPMAKLPGKETRTDDAVVNESVLMVAKLMGNTAEDVKKYGDLSA
jgi:phage I-like protein